MHAFRSDEAQKELRSTHLEEHETATETKFNEWTEYTMNQEMGESCASALRASGKVDWIPCPITDSKEQHMIRWLVPIKTKTETDRDRKGLEASANNDDATLEDLENLRGMSFHGTGATASASLTATAPAPPPPPTPMEVIAKRISDYRAGKEHVLMKFQGMEVYMKQVQSKAEGSQLKKKKRIH